MTTARNTNSSTLFSGGDCSDCDVVVLPGDTLIINANKTIHNLTIYENATLKVQDTKTLTVNSLIMRVESDTAAPVINLNNSGAIVLNNDELYFDMRVDESRYYWFSLPFESLLQEVSYADAASNGKTPVYRTDYWIKFYDGAKRADDANAGVQDKTYWKHVAPKGGSYTMQAGQGYELMIADQSEEFFSGQTYNHTKRVVRFTMKPNVTSWLDLEREIGKVAAVEPSTCSNPLNAVQAGWNLIGNPYMHKYNTGSVTGESGLRNGAWVQNKGTGYYEVDGETTTVPYITLYDPKTRTYSQRRAENYTLRPFEAFFVQINEGSQINYANPMIRPSLAAAYRRMTEKDKPLYTGVELTGNGHSDCTGIVLYDEYSLDYRTGEDLVKWSNTGALNLFTINGYGQPLAFNGLSDDDAIAPIPVGVEFPEDGTYTFAFDAKQYSLNALNSLQLIDYKTNITTDLLFSNYEFQANEGTVNDRFALLVRRAKNHQDVTTDLDNISNGSADNTRKIIRDGQLFILRDGKIFNAVGIEVK